MYKRQNEYRLEAWIIFLNFVAPINVNDLRRIYLIWKYVKGRQPKLCFGYESGTIVYAVYTLHTES